MSDLPDHPSDNTLSSDTPAIQTTADYDGAWKNALDTYFPEFMALFWPKLNEQIDWTHTPVFLDKELQNLTRAIIQTSPRVCTSTICASEKSTPASAG